MKLDLKHPLWTHVPGALLLGVSAVAFWRAWPLPEPAPVHFGGSGHPDRWGSQWEIPFIVILVSFIALAISTAVDEFWARQERRKRFNWLSVADELFLGLMTATSIAYVETLETEPYVFHHSWALTGGFMVIAALCAVLLEVLRPFRPSARTLVQEDTKQLEQEVASRQKSGRSWFYWESQCPRYVKWYLPIFGVGLLALGITSWNDNRWASSGALAGGIVVLFLIGGGFRVSVTPRQLSLRAGLLRIPLLKLALQDITDAAVHTFSPLADFGGYGIRRNREMLAFFLQGNAGVKLTTVKGKKYLIGSEHPERLAAVIRGATE
jgi:hypothetical protein